MSNIEIYKKPLLVKLEEQPKVRTFEMNERIAKSTQIVKLLLSDLGVGKNSDTDHHIRTIKFISESMVNYSFEEIEKAFQMFIAGDFREKPFQQLNAVIVGKVMSEYENHKRETLKVYRQKETMRKQELKPPSGLDISKQIEESIEEMRKEYYKTGKIVGIVTHLYSHLFKKGVLPQHNREYIAKITLKSIQIAKSEAMTEASLSLDKHRGLKKVISEIEEAGNSAVKIIAKRIILQEYFEQIKMVDYDELTGK